MCCKRLRLLLAPTFYWPFAKTYLVFVGPCKSRKNPQAYFGSSLGFHVICILLQSFSQKVSYNQPSIGPIL